MGIEEKNNNILEKKFFSPFTTLNIMLFLVVILSSFYFFYIKKDFNFIVEVPCNSESEECIVRDCSNPDNCPPNGLSEFKRYSLKARDFLFCQNEDCSSFCKNNEINCIPVVCEEDSMLGETCSLPVTVESINNIYE